MFAMSSSNSFQKRVFKLKKKEKEEESGRERVGQKVSVGQCAKQTAAAGQRGAKGR
jgi:hypothetical protein